MLSRLILAATAVAALTAFVRDDAGTSATAAPQPPISLVTPARAEAAPGPTNARPVRVVLAPLYASTGETSPATTSAGTFIPTPGSPVGPRGAALVPALSGQRATAQWADDSPAQRKLRHRKTADTAAAVHRPGMAAQQASRAGSLPGVVLR